MPRNFLGPGGGAAVVGTRVAPAGSTLMPLSRVGTLTVAAGTKRWYPPFDITILGISANVSTAPAGTSIVLDVNRDGTTLYTTQSNRPSIAFDAFRAAETVPDVTAVAATSYLTVDVDQVGSTTAGADLVVNIRYRRT